MQKKSKEHFHIRVGKIFIHIISHILFSKDKIKIKCFLDRKRRKKGKWQKCSFYTLRIFLYSGEFGMQISSRSRQKNEVKKNFKLLIIRTLTKLLLQ